VHLTAREKFGALHDRTVGNGRNVNGIASAMPIQPQRRIDAVSLLESAWIDSHCTCYKIIPAEP